MAISDPLARVDAASRLATEYSQRRDFRTAAGVMSIAVEAATHVQDLPNLLKLAAGEVALCHSAKDSGCEAGALVNLANAESLSGYSESALNRLKGAIALYKQAGRSNDVVWARFNAAGVRYDLDDVSGALSELLEIEPIVEQQAEPNIITFDLALADVLVHAGQPERALKLCALIDGLMARQFAAAGRTYTASEPLVKSEAIRGLAQAKLGRADATVSAFRHAVMLAKTALDRFETSVAQAEALSDLGRPADALPIVQNLAPTAGRMGVIEERNFHELATRIYKANGRADLALEQEAAAALMRSSLYRGNLAEAVATSDVAIALAERQVAADQMSRRNAEERSASERILGDTRIAAILSILGVIVAGGITSIVSRIRQRRAREAEMAAERARIAADVHDTLLQGLIGVSLQVRAAASSAESIGAAAVAARLKTIAAQASYSLAEARRALTRLHGKPVPAVDNLAQSVSTWIQSVQRPQGLSLTFQADPNLPSFDPDRTQELRCVVQEAATNALRHSGGSQVHVELRARGNCVEATVCDDGRGFTPSPSAMITQDQWGLRLMQERMARIGGVLQVCSAPGEGTLVTASVPC